MARTPFWQDLLVAEVVATSAQTILGLHPQLDSTATRGMTIVRTIIDLAIAPAPPGATIGTQQVSLGIGVAAQEAFATNVVPDPNSGSDRPARGWLWRTKCMVIDMPEGVPNIVKCIGDFRGKRRLDNGEAYIAINNDGFQATAFSINIIGIIRTFLLEN